MNLNATLSPDEIDELSEFLLSDAMPAEGMDISALDGFLTAMVIGPAPLPADEWLPLICGGEEPRFDSEEQILWLTEQILRLANTIVERLAADPPAFEPILYAEEVEGETHWIADSWCNAFMQVIESGTAEWLPFFENPSNAELLAPMITLGTPEGEEALDAAPDAVAKIDLCVEMLGRACCESANSGAGANAPEMAFARAPSGPVATPPVHAAAAASSKGAAPPEAV